MNGAYLQYELPRFWLDFVSGKAKDYKYRSITETERERYYEENADLFMCYFGDKIPYENVGDVIEKQLKEIQKFMKSVKSVCKYSRNRVT